LILLSVWAVGGLIVIGLLGFFYVNSVAQAPEPPQPVATFVIPFDKENTAKTAALLALEEAQNWQEDVELVAVSTQWPEATLQSLARTEVWDFRFFSPGHDRVLFTFVATNEQVVSQPHLNKFRNSPGLITQTDWIIDSDQALSIWVNHGGGVFLQNFPGSRVEVLLRQAPATADPVWDIIGISADQSQIFYLSIDATDGQIRNQN
jgi:hypothetical protein